MKNMEELRMIWNIAERCVEAASTEHGEAFQYGIFKKISEWCPCNRNVEKLINDQFAKYNNGGQYTLKLPPVTWKVFTRKCSRWLIMVMNYQRGDLYSFTCRKACSIHKTQKMLLLSYLMETVKFIFVPEIYPNIQLQTLWKNLFFEWW